MSDGRITRSTPIFAIWLPTGGLWGYRYGTEDDAKIECDALDETGRGPTSYTRLGSSDEIEQLTTEVTNKDTYIDYLRDSLDLIGSIDLDEPSIGLRDCVRHAQGALVPDQDEVVHFDAAGQGSDSGRQGDGDGCTRGPG